MTWNQAWLWVMQFAAFSGVTLGAAFLIFRKYGERWLESRFQAQHEKLKHEHQKELENVRLSIQMMYSRVSKIHEREFEVLPKAWLLLHQAHGSAVRAMNILKFYPNVDKMPPEQLDEFLSTTKLTMYQRNELKRSSDRQAFFVKATDGISLDEAGEQCRLLNNYLIEHQIFMGVELGKQFRAVSKTLLTSVTDYSFGKGDFDRELTKEAIAKLETVAPAIDEIEASVQKRLHYNDA